VLVADGVENCVGIKKKAKLENKKDKNKRKGVIKERKTKTRKKNIT
jgi:hypothetical protein